MPKLRPIGFLCVVDWIMGCKDFGDGRVRPRSLKCHELSKESSQFIAIVATWWNLHVEFEAWVT